MELLIIIVQELDFPRLSSAFIHNHVLATKFCTEGLYLNKRNITLMVCIPKEREEEILAISAAAVPSGKRSAWSVNLTV